MSMHASLRAGDSLATQKTVLKRIDRIKLMQSKNEWSEDSSVLGLPKVKVVKVKTGKKKKQ